MRAELAISVSLIALAAAAPALAQDGAAPGSQPSEVGEIVVTGIRGALEQAETVKREAAVVVDGVSADDIGQLPDTSISESLTRIPGVTSNDTARGSDQVALRGLGPDLVSTEYNGRILPTADGVNRRVGLAGLPSEGLSGAYAQKSPKAATIEGGVAGILQLNPIRPLETRRRGLTLVLRGLYDQYADKASRSEAASPLGARGEATFVGRLGDNVGLSVTYAGLRDYNLLAGRQFENWRLGTGARSDLNGDGLREALPTNAGPIVTHINTERHTVNGMLQWRASPDLMVSVDGIYSTDKYNNHSRRFFGFELWNGATLGAPTASQVENSSVTQFEGQAALYRGVINNGKITDTTKGAGIKVEYDNGGPLKASADVSYFRAGRDRFTPLVNFDIDATTGLAPSQRRAFGYDLTDRMDPKLVFEPVSADDFAIQQINTTTQKSYDEIAAVRLDFEYALDRGFFEGLEFGLRFDDRAHDQRVDNTLYSFANLAARPDLDSSMLLRTGYPYVGLSGRLGGPTAIAFPYYDGELLLRLGTTAPGVVVSEQFALDVAAAALIEEQTWAGYGQLNFGSDRLRGNVGLRYVVTDTVSSGQAGTTPQNVVDRKFSNTYRYWLPSFNARYELVEDFYLRFAAARTMSRPLFEQLRVGSVTDLSGGATGAITINTGNPDLKPFTADGVDVGFEWYPSPDATLAVAAYYKRVKNFTLSQQRTGEVELPGGGTSPAIITEFVNDPEARFFRGFEIQGKKDFTFLPGWMSDLGVQANYNYNDTDLKETFTSLAGDPTVATTAQVLPINFSRHTVNGILYYDGDPLTVRLAYRFSSKYSRRFANGYQYRPGGQVDLNFTYKVAENVSIIGSATNLFNTGEYRQTADSRDLGNDELLQFVGYRGRDIVLGVRMQF